MTFIHLDNSTMARASDEGYKVIDAYSRPVRLGVALRGRGAAGAWRGSRRPLYAARYRKDQQCHQVSGPSR
jgi:hypothetical protein